MTTSDYRELEAVVAGTGLMSRGAFHPTREDAVPAPENGQAAATLVLLGNAGPGFWPRFQTAPEAGDGTPHAMNRWTTRIVTELSGQLGATPLFPFGGPPYHPFQRWAQRAEPVSASPLGILIHPRYGLWHAYRAALVFAEALDLPAREAEPSPCESCRDRPCLTACPVGAFSASGYDVPVCADHIGGDRGTACLSDGCLARHACPVGKDYLYPEGQAGFHMRAFLAAVR